MINRVTLIGRLTRDVDSGATASGISFARFSLAVQRSFSNQQGVREADFINCVAWRGTADVITKYVKKGDLFAVGGRIQTGSYQDQNGNTRYTFDVLVEDFQLMGSNNSKTSNDGNFNQNQGFNNQPSQNQGFNNSNSNNGFNNNNSQPLKNEEDLLNDFESGFNLDDDVPF